ncbi:MAG: hypothetical protein JXB29_09310 [Sedimentisphaerales bacterium]|nr:hypothetical protein [Sedimentisphaerales bacterium]
MFNKCIKIVVFFILMVLCLAVFANSMTKPVSRDEQMYCAGAVLLAKGNMIYRDFSYVAQMPYHALLCAALFKATGTTHYLLVVRVLSSICDILVILCIVCIYRCLFNHFRTWGWLLGLAGAILYLCNPFVDYANGLAWNHDVVIACVMLATVIFTFVNSAAKPKFWLYAVIGALLTVATCMRITTVLVQLLFFAVLFFKPVKLTKQRFKPIVPFLIGTLLAAVWPIWTIIAGPRAFFLNLFRIPALNSQFLHSIGMFHSKMGLTLVFLGTLSCLLLVLMTGYLYAAALYNLRRFRVFGTRILMLTALLPIGFFIIAYLPPTMWIQYFAMPVPFFVISFAYPMIHLRKSADGIGHSTNFRIASAGIAACVFAAVISYPAVLYRIPKLLDFQNWVPLTIHSVSDDIAAKTKEPKLILTLSPLFALEGGCDIYLQLSAGPFVYRVADRMRPAELHVTNTAGANTLGQILKDAPPSAVIVGRESEFLEFPLLQEAVGPDREKWTTKQYSNGIVAYFRR